MHIWTKFKTKWLAWKTQQRLKRLKLYFPIYCKIHGVSTADRQGALAQSRAGDRLQAVHIPLPDKPHNVYVYSIGLNRVLGNLQESFSKKLVKAFGPGFCRDAVIENITGGAPMYELNGCNICIFNSMEYMQGETDYRALRGDL